LKISILISKENESIFDLTLATPFINQQQNTMKLNNKKIVEASEVIPTNASLSSSQSTDDSPSSSVAHLTNKLRLFHRMITSSNNKSTISRSYNLRAFEIAHHHYSVVIHFLDDTERTFYVDVSDNKLEIDVPFFSSSLFSSVVVKELNY
jgi:hypothetical protein